MDISTTPEHHEHEDIWTFRKVHILIDCVFWIRKYMYGAYGFSRFLNYRSKWAGKPPDPPRRRISVKYRFGFEL